MTWSSDGITSHSIQLNSAAGTTMYYYVLPRTTPYYYALLRTAMYYYVLLHTTTYYYVLLTYYDDDNKHDFYNAKTGARFVRFFIAQGSDCSESVCLGYSPHM